MFSQLQDIGGLVDGIGGSGGDTIGITIRDLPCLVQFPERVRGTGKVGGDAQAADIGHPTPLGIHTILDTRYGIIGVKFKEIT